jgi:hypothetical protein
MARGRGEVAKKRPAAGGFPLAQHLQAEEQKSLPTAISGVASDFIFLKANGVDLGH